MMDRAEETPLTELLKAVPETARLEWPIQWAEDGTETGHSMCPVGTLAHRAANAIERLQAELDEIAKALHYPNCWDTMAYPTLLDAITEINHCSVCEQQIKGE